MSTTTPARLHVIDTAADHRPTVITDGPKHLVEDAASVKEAVELLNGPNLRRYRQDEEVRFAVKRARMWSQVALELLNDRKA